MTNYLADQNPYQLAAPPAWFLAQLWERDRDLVILPGLSQPVYRLARRVRRSKMGSVRPIAHDSETSRMLTHGLIPVTAILPFTRWGAEFFQWLDDHDTWKAGGGDKAADLIDANEARRLERIQRDQDSEAEARGGSGYRALKLRTGQTVFVHAGA